LTRPWHPLGLALGVSALLHLAVLLAFRSPEPSRLAGIPISVLILPLERGAAPAVPPAAGAKPKVERQKENGVDSPPRPVGPATPEDVDGRRSASITVGPASSPDEPPASRLADASTYVAAERLRTAPRLAARLTVMYPRLAYQQRRKAVVMVQLMIDERGAVTEAIPLPGASDDFVDAALEALRRARFTPAEGPGGRPARARACFAVSFVLE
jgi:TonB family protein